MMSHAFNTHYFAQLVPSRSGPWDHSAPAQLAEAVKRRIALAPQPRHLLALIVVVRAGPDPRRPPSRDRLRCAGSLPRTRGRRRGSLPLTSSNWTETSPALPTDSPDTRDWHWSNSSRVLCNPRGAHLFTLSRSSLCPPLEALLRLLHRFCRKNPVLTLSRRHGVSRVL